MEILAIRMPPYPQECLAVHKHSETMEGGDSKSWERITRKSSPLLHSLQVSLLEYFCPGSIPLGSLPHPPPTSAQTPQGRETDVTTRETEARISHVSPGLQGRV